nr:beta-ketoacyl-ACP synthase III [Spirochaeta thermophila]
MTQPAILSTGSYAPPRRLTNEELATMVDTSDEWIHSHTGIRARHIAADHEAASDLGTIAGSRALDAAGISPEEVDMVLVATSTPDYLSYPATACIIQDNLSCTRAAAMDITAACTGFVYGLETAACYIKAGRARYVLVIGTEVNSRILNWNDRNTCVLFGDAAGAVLVGPSPDSTSSIEDSVLRSLGNDALALLRPKGGSRSPLTFTPEEEKDFYVQMNGKKVYLFAVSAMGKTIEKLLRRNDLTIDDIAYIVPHQANVRIIQACSQRLGIPMEKFYLNLEEYANTSAASIPLALDEMNRKGLLTRGDRILTVGFGAGLTYGGNLIIW